MAKVQSKDVKECAFFMCLKGAFVAEVSSSGGPVFLTVDVPDLTSAELDAERRKYFSRKSAVEPMAYAESLESVRTLIKQPKAAR